MIKERCKKCGRIYVGEVCPCAAGRRYHQLLCDCGEPAVEVYCDRLGEWPMCRVCLKEFLGLDGAIPLPDHDTESQKGSEADARTYPLALTRRQYEIARLAPKSDKEIAKRLSISSSTVKSHMKTIFKKLGVQSRHEIPHVLSRVEGDQAGVCDPGTDIPAGVEAAVEANPDEPATVTVSISTRVNKITELREFIKQIGGFLDRP